MLVSAVHQRHDLSVAIGSSRSSAGHNADADADPASYSSGGDTRGDTAGGKHFTFAREEVKSFDF